MRRIQRAVAGLLFPCALLAAFPLSAIAGGFVKKGPFLVGNFPEAVAIGDFNSDGNPDLAIAVGGTETITLLLGDGHGNFLPDRSFRVGAPPSSLAVADFNHDGNLDIATANGADPSQVGSVSVLLGNGDGTFRPTTNYQAGLQPIAVVVADLNHDGAADIIVADSYEFQGGNRISVMLGRGDGGFRRPVGYSSDVKPVALVAGDFNHDGNTDIAAVNYLGASLSIFLGNGDGTFQKQVSYPLVDRPVAVATADLDGDGNLDIVVGIIDPDFGFGGLSVLLGRPDGTFRPRKLYGFALGLNFFSVALGDLDGDGRPDLVAGDSSGVTTLRGFGNGTFGQPMTYKVANPFPIALALGDLNHDRKLDIAAVSLDPSYVAVLLNTQ
jgi:VCBS repeat protein